MSHTTYGYTKEKLGFEPDREERRLSHYAGVKQNNGHAANGHGNGHHYLVEDHIGGVYEENLSKFKGLSCYYRARLNVYQTLPSADRPHYLLLNP